jgi:succinoglycan biosynthesis protein ExoV
MDRLNEWLLLQYLRKYATLDETSVLFGGVTFNKYLVPGYITPFSRQILLLGTGVDENFPLTHPAHNWSVYAVRGPLSAQKLSLPPQKSVTDSAILLKGVLPPLPQQRPYPRTYLAEFQSIRHRHALEKICAEFNIQLVSLQSTMEKILEAIQQSECVITDSLHGAIVADTLRIPWIPTLPSQGGDFPWRDWCASMDIPFSAIQRHEDPHTPDPKIPPAYDTQWAQQMKRLLTQTAPLLSSEAQFNTQYNAMRNSLDRLIQDLKSGRYAPPLPV